MGRSTKVEDELGKRLVAMPRDRPGGGHKWALSLLNILEKQRQLGGNNLSRKEGFKVLGLFERIGLID